MAQEPIDFKYLQEIIISGIKEMQLNANLGDAVFFMGDTGVGKSTLMTYMLGEKLTVSQIGLKPNLSGPVNSKIKIGHEKYSETSVPNQQMIDGKSFYDCPGFNDNKSRECDIANSFYLQRLFDLYERVKLVMVIDQSYLTEARAHRLPNLVNKLRESFGTLESINKSVLLIINRCNPDFSEIEIKQQFLKMLETQNLITFKSQDRQFFRYLIDHKQYLLFPTPKRNEVGSEFSLSLRLQILSAINNLDFIEGIHINNIISEHTKLAIRDYIDVLTSEVESTVQNAINRLKSSIKVENKTEQELFALKQSIIGVIESRQGMESKHNFDRFYQFYGMMVGGTADLLKIEGEIKIMNFFKGIYNKTQTYFHNLVNIVISTLSILLTEIDRKLQKIREHKQLLKKKEEAKRQEQEKRQEEKRERENRQMQKQQERLQKERNEKENQSKEQNDFVQKKPRRVFDDILDHGNIDDITKSKVNKKSKKSVTIAESCLTLATENSEIKPITHDPNSKKMYRAFSFQSDTLKDDSPEIAFKKKLITAGYMLKQVECEAILLSNKFKMLVNSSQVTPNLN